MLLVHVATCSVHLPEQKSVLTPIQHFLLVAGAWEERDAQRKRYDFSANLPQHSLIVPHAPDKIKQLQTAAQMGFSTPASAVRL